MRMRIEMQDALCASGLGFVACPGYADLMTILSENIEALSDRYENQQEFADKVGATQATVSRWIKGALPRPANLLALARLGKCSIEQLMTVPIVDWTAVPAGDLSEKTLIGMLEIAIREIPATTTFGDWPRLAASSLHTQLEQLKASPPRSEALSEDTSTEAAKGARSRRPKKTTARG